jgi:hypothetical protein
MPPKRKLEVESYESIEARIQEAVDDLEKRLGDEEPRKLRSGHRKRRTSPSLMQSKRNRRR